MKQRCAGDKTVRTNSKAFLHAIYSTTGQGRPQPAYIAGGPILLHASDTSLRAAICAFTVCFGALEMACRHIRLPQPNP